MKNKKLVFDYWTEAEYQRAVRLREEGLSFGEIASLMNRTQKSVWHKLNPKENEHYCPPEEPSIVIPEWVVIERDERLGSHPRDWNSFVQGDPWVHDPRLHIRVRHIEGPIA